MTSFRTIVCDTPQPERRRGRRPPRGLLVIEAE